ncbi:MAG: DUF485 domain-containing protein [Isosphaeraceae bacterium]
MRSRANSVGYADTNDLRSFLKTPGPIVSQPPNDHGAAPPTVPASATEHVRANARLGLVLFAVYLAIYAGFVGLSAFAPRLMSQAPLGGLNAAILYGMGLIIAAFLLALLYMALCRKDAGKGASDDL